MEKTVKLKDQDDEENEEINKVALLQTVCDLLNPRENVIAALKRYGGRGKEKEGRDMDKFNKLTEAADTLLNNGYNDITHTGNIA